MKDLLLVIPARYASTRFPGKPLAEIAGKTMLQRVWEQAEKTKGFAVRTIIATDDERIYTAAKAFGADVLLTAPEHQSGTDRCFEVARKTGFNFDILINIQGDEPFIQPRQIETLAARLLDSDSRIGTLKRQIDTQSETANPNIVKVVCDYAGKALYFSRSPLPYNRDRNKNTIPSFRHLGIYAFKKEVIPQIETLVPSPLEETEKLEQLRWLENGHSVLVIETDFQSPAVDTPEDLLFVEKFLEDNPSLQ